MRFLARVVRILYRVVVAVLTLLVAAANTRLYHSSDPASPSGLAESKAQLAFIRDSLSGGGGESMQGLFPEGYFFTHAQYGLAWADLGAANNEVRQDAIREARWALEQLEAPEGKSPFPPGLDPPYGVFYNGWSAWLNGRIMQFQGPGERDAEDIARYKDRCDALASAFESSQTPFLMAYTGQAWPVDSVVAIAGLRQYDRLFPPRYEALISRWLAQAQARLDPHTGLLPHRVDPATGAMLEGARGSSQSMINHLLPQIDPVWGREQYLAFREQFVVVPFGVREYPAGNPGLGDVDSGPLLFGVSASASVVTIGAARANHDAPLAAALSAGAETVGLPLAWGGQKRYGLGLLPVGDTMLVWSRSALPPPDISPAPPNIVPGGWRWPLHGLSLAVLIVLWSPEWLRIVRPKKLQGMAHADMS